MLKIPFTVSARTARLIGQENFANAEGAVIELVKNSYDADASVCIILFNTQTNTLYILDNGDGMNEGIIRKHWMTIGTNNKREENISKNGRIITGAKGIGRFALDRLGTKCKMTTKTKETEGLVWEVDWTQFEKKEAVINDINATLSTIENFRIEHEVRKILHSIGLKNKLEILWNENKGTLVEINGLKDVWENISFESLFSNLQILIPPLETSTFQVYYYISNNVSQYGQIISTLCNDFDYQLKAIVNEDQSVKITIYRNELDVGELIQNNFFDKSKLNQPCYNKKAFEYGYFQLEVTLGQLLPGLKQKDVKNSFQDIGPFEFNFFFMKRGGGQEKNEGIGKYPYKFVNYRDRAKWLDTFGGIKIFRDNFRIRPYGEPKSNSFDWLGLGNRALSNPTVTRPGYHVRPQQVYGVIHISRLKNIFFDDKSNREGLQENNTFLLFKQILISIVEQFENDRNQIMMTLKRIYDEGLEGEKSKEAAEKIISDQKKKKNKGVNKEEIETLVKAIEAYKNDYDDLFEEQKLLRVLASTGLIVTSFAHEFKNHSDSIVFRNTELRKILEKLINSTKIQNLPSYNNPFIMLNEMKTQDERLKAWLDFSLASVRKDKRARRIINMVSYFEGLEKIWVSLLSRKHVKLSVDKWKFLEVNFKGFEIDLDSIFHNLLANSIDAFMRPDANDTREIKLSFSFNPVGERGISIVYEDSGPGLSSEIIDPNQIFQPFFTTKRDSRTGEKIGTGLGMWIIRSTIDEYNGDIEFIKIRHGFKLKIDLPHY